MNERERERDLSLLWYFSAREMPFVALYRFCFWHFDPEEGFIRWLEVHFSVLRQKNLMNEPVPARSAVFLYRTTRHHFSSTIPTFCRTLVMCTPVSIFFFTQDGDSFALKMELNYISLLYLLSKISFHAAPLSSKRVSCCLLCVHTVTLVGQ